MSSFSSRTRQLFALVLALQIIPSTIAYRLVFHSFKSIVTARIDPLMYPGRVSQHSHHVVGGSGFNRTYDPVKQRAAKCSNFAEQADKSNYWSPQIYKVLDNGTYLSMHTGTRVYYEFQQNLPDGTERTPFPYDFRMIAGNPTRKTYNDSSYADRLLMYYCGGEGREFHSFSLPNVTCHTLITKVFFPTCWNGEAFDEANPSAHMAYPTEIGNFASPICPEGYPLLLPSILMENFHFDADLPATDPSRPVQYILANGDTTGYGLHADFANGWDQDTLEGMLSECTTTPIAEPSNEVCPPLAKTFNQTTGDLCEYESLIPNEHVGFDGKWGHYTMKYLPGCNLPWGVNGSKPICPPTMRRLDPKGWIKPIAGFIWS